MRKAGRDRGIDRIAAALQHIGADVGRDLLLRHHHAMLGDHGMRRIGIDHAPPRLGARPARVAGTQSSAIERDYQRRNCLRHVRDKARSSKFCRG